MKNISRWTIEDVKKELHKLDPVLEETDHAFYAGEVLLSSLVVGADLRKLRRFTGLPMTPLRRFSKRLRAAKIWVGNKVNVSWAWERNSAIAFWCDVAVAMGYLKRVARKAVKNPAAKQGKE